MHPRSRVSRRFRPLLTALLLALVIHGCEPAEDTPSPTPESSATPPPDGQTPASSPTPGTPDEGTPGSSPGPTDAPTATPAPTPVPTVDQDRDGVFSDEDCDDTDPAAYPGAAEVCDSTDNDCDRQVDEADTLWLPDLDEDGFGGSDASGGDPLTGACQPTGYVHARGDCDDADPALHPGADDPDGDGVDQDCGSTEGPEPHVGLGSSSRASIREALSAAASGDTVWVGPGEYLENALSPGGKGLTLASTHFADGTVVRSSGDTAFSITGHEGPGTVLDGFTVTGSAGSGIDIQDSSPTIIGCVATGNGRGATTGNSSAAFIDCVFSSNGSGGVYDVSESTTFTGCSFLNNTAEEGAGYYGSGHLIDCLIEGNHATSKGGGVYIWDARLTRCTIRGNTCDSQGGGVFIQEGGSARLEYCSILGNEAPEGGGVIVLAPQWKTEPVLEHCTIAGNRAEWQGGGMVTYRTWAQPVIRNSILAWNAGLDLCNDGGAPQVSYSDLFSPSGVAHNLESLDPSNLEVDPGFITWRVDYEPFWYDTHLRPGSAVRIASSPYSMNPDGSPAELGAYGGPDADRTYYDDRDGDGLYDGWERRHGLSPETPDDSEDPDHDGLDNAGELAAGTDPWAFDGDRDGAPDGEEVSGGSNPGNWYSVPGRSTPRTAQVPGSFATLQAAVDAARPEGRIQVGPGAWNENLRVDARRIGLFGRDGAGETTLTAGTQRAITARGAWLELRGVTITGGFGDQAVGMGMLLSGSVGVLEDLIVRDNGRGYMTSGDLSQGGGLAMYDSNPTIRGCRFEGNAAGRGGAIYQFNGAPTTTGCLFTGNQASMGGALYLEKAASFITECRFEANETSDSGGAALKVHLGAPKVSHCRFEGNFGDEGGAVSDYMSQLEMSGCVMTGNETDGSGGAVVLAYSGARLSHCVIVGNRSGEQAGGVHLYGDGPNGQTVQITASILAYNTGYNLWSEPALQTPPQVTWSDLYNEHLNHNLETLDPSNLILEPGFLSYAAGLPTDFHLASDSALIDAGRSGELDVDGSREDIGGYGGAEGDGWDLDADGFPDWFWPGGIEDAPEGMNPAAYDPDDLDPEVPAQ